MPIGQYSRQPQNIMIKIRWWHRYTRRRPAPTQSGGFFPTLSYLRKINLNGKCPLYFFHFFDGWVSFLNLEHDVMRNWCRGAGPTPTMFDDHSANITRVLDRGITDE